MPANVMGGSVSRPTLIARNVVPQIIASAIHATAVNAITLSETWCVLVGAALWRCGPVLVVEEL